MTSPRAAFLEAAIEIGFGLVMESLWQGACCNWIGNTFSPDNGTEKNTVRPLGPFLYDGTAGISLFLGVLYSHTGEKIFRDAAVAGLRTACRQWKPGQNKIQGMFNGGIGIGFATDIVGNAVDSEELRNLSTEIICKKFTPASFDVISGSAGVVPYLIFRANRDGHIKLLDRSRELGDHLLIHAETSRNGISWRTTHDCQANLTGFAHGTAGMGWALLELGMALQDDRYVHASLAAFEYEDNTFIPHLQNWPDFRTIAMDSKKQITCSNAWCHGAPGISLARIQSYHLQRNPDFLKTATSGIATTIKAVLESKDRLGSSHSLCHGIFGNLDCILSFGRISKSTPHIEFAERLAQELLAKQLHSKPKWRSGLANRSLTPGLMLGLAGVGYAFLRLYAPSTPNILLPNGS